MQQYSLGYYSPEMYSEVNPGLLETSNHANSSSRSHAKSHKSAEFSYRSSYGLDESLNTRKG